MAIGKGEVIAAGVNAELDDVRRLAFNSQEALDAIRDREAEATGISGLKVAFNNVFGYYLEVRNAHKDKVPEGWIRKQTLTQAERYITEELKELESQILSAKDKAQALETTAFSNLVAACAGELPSLMGNARAMGLLDMLSSHAESAVELGYTRPRMHDGRGISISEGRHPVIERQLPPGETYVAYDIQLDPDTRQILMVTGPNMSGKSALLRQTALISLMAQAGSFVPAKHADLGILDRIFTRVGASDNISSGESTFMVEMNETAAILNNLTPAAWCCWMRLGAAPARTMASASLGHRRTFARDEQTPAPDAVRHTLPRAERHEPALVADCQCERERERDERQGGFPAQAGPRRQQPQLRHPCGPLGRHAANVGAPRGRRLGIAGVGAGEGVTPKTTCPVTKPPICPRLSPRRRACK